MFEDATARMTWNKTRKRLSLELQSKIVVTDSVRAGFMTRGVSLDRTWDVTAEATRVGLLFAVWSST